MQASAPPTLPSQTAHLRVASLNVWGLWSPLSRHLSERMRAIVEHTAGLSLDVFAIQESWTEDGREMLVSGLREMGLEHVWHNPKAAGGSGLLVVSRHPLREPRFRRFRLSGLPERMDHGDWASGKGVVALTVDTPAGPVDILDTHLVAHYAAAAIDNYFGHRVGQVIEIAELLSGHDRPVVALGDFNLRESGVEYRVLTGLSGLVDAAAALDRRFDTIVAPHPYRTDDHRERIDYVWTRSGKGMTARVRELQRGFDGPLILDGEDGAYSDHAGLIADLEFSRAPMARAWPGADDAALALARDGLEQGRRLAADRRRSLRVTATAGLGMLGACAAASQVTRREWLRRSLWLGAGLSATLGGAALGLAEIFGREELDALNELEAVAESLRRPS